MKNSVYEEDDDDEEEEEIMSVELDQWSFYTDESGNKSE
jgi:hypothetical protein